MGNSGKRGAIWNFARLVRIPLYWVIYEFLQFYCKGPKAQVSISLASGLARLEVGAHVTPLFRVRDADIVLQF